MLAVMTVAACAGHRPPSQADPQAPVVIRDVAVVDVVSGTLRPHTTVTAVGARISVVAPAADTNVPAGALVIDGGGRFLMPGLWDMHSHSLWSPEAMPAFLPLYVAQGVGQVADMVLLRSNPLANIRATREIDAVVLRGQVLDRRSLDDLLAAAAKSQK